MDWFNFIAYKLTPDVRLRKSRKFFGSFSWNRPAVAISNRLALLATRIVMRSRFLDHLRVVLNFRIRLCLRAVVNFRAPNLILVHTLLNLVRWSLILARFRWGSHSLLFNLFINHRWSRRLILQWVGKQNLTKLTRYRMINIHRFSNRLCDCSLLSVVW